MLTGRGLSRIPTDRSDRRPAAPQARVKGERSKDKSVAFKSSHALILRPFTFREPGFARLPVAPIRVLCHNSRTGYSKKTLLISLAPV